MACCCAQRQRGTCRCSQGRLEIDFLRHRTDSLSHFGCKFLATFVFRMTGLLFASSRMTLLWGPCMVSEPGKSYKQEPSKRRETVLEWLLQGCCQRQRQKVLARSGPEGIFVAELAKDGAKTSGRLDSCGGDRRPSLFARKAQEAKTAFPSWRWGLPPSRG